MAAIVATADEVEALRREMAELRALVQAQQAKPEPATMEEAARFYGVSVRTIRRWVKSREIESVRAGRTVRVWLDGADPTR